MSVYILKYDSTADDIHSNTKEESIDRLSGKAFEYEIMFDMYELIIIQFA